MKFCLCPHKGLGRPQRQLLEQGLIQQGFCGFALHLSRQRIFGGWTDVTPAKNTKAQKPSSDCEWNALYNSRTYRSQELHQTSPHTSMCAVATPIDRQEILFFFNLFASDSQDTEIPGHLKLSADVAILGPQQIQIWFYFCFNAF